MRNRPLAKRYSFDITFGIFGRLCNGILYFVGFAQSDPDMSVIITDSDDRIKTEAASAFYNLCYTVDGDELILQIEFR